jgi:hypothetical protein
MTVSELIEELKKMPQEAKVMHFWDGRARTEIDFVWVSNAGYVVTAEQGYGEAEGEDAPLGMEQYAIPKMKKPYEMPKEWAEWYKYNNINIEDIK